MTLPRVVQLPVWLEGAVQPLPFYLCAAQIHLGNTPHSGHYRAVFFGSGPELWITDDSVCARRVVSADASLIQQNVYIVYLRPIHGSASSDPAGFAAPEP